MKIMRAHRRSASVTVGPWQCCIAWDRLGRFGNGSRWFSGWYRWAEQPPW